LFVIRNLNTILFVLKYIYLYIFHQFAHKGKINSVM